MSKKLLSAILILIMILCLANITPAAAASSDIKVVLDGTQLQFDVQPQIINGRTMVPMRNIFAALGFDIQWNGTDQSVTGTKNNKTIKLWIGKTDVMINDQTVKFDTAPVVKDGRTLVPVRVVAQGADAAVDWIGTTSTVIITSNTTGGYYYFLYNADKVSTSDMDSIIGYANKFKNIHVIMKDVSDYASAASIYDMLKKDAVSQHSNPLGIQIFGSSEDVPAFDWMMTIKFYTEDPMFSKYNHVEGDEKSKTDYFYSNFNNDSKVFTSDLSPYKIFDLGTKVDLTPQWKVVRLPLNKGKFAGFIKKYYEYSKQRAAQNVPYVNFSSPTFGNMPERGGEGVLDENGNLKYQPDDLSHFIERLDTDFNILDSAKYRLYGNQSGDVKVNSNIVGDYTVDNIVKENKSGIVDFIFNGHGGFTITQWDRTETKLLGTTQSHLLSRETLNTTFAYNYYTIMTWSCDDAYDLSKQSFIHDMMAYGKCMNAFSAPGSISFNGEDNTLSLEKTKVTPYYLVYELFNSFNKNMTRSDAMLNAKKATLTELLNHQDSKWSPNFECGIQNIVILHDLGLIEYKEE